MNPSIELGINRWGRVIEEVPYGRDGETVLREVSLRHLEYEEKRQERAASDYAKLHSCEFCKGSKLYSCTGYDCREPYRQAYDYALSRIRERQET